jgi:homoserine kinase
VGNVAVGFDILGHPLEGPGDRVTVRRIDESVVRIVSITGVVEDLPHKAETNTATAGLLALREELDLAVGFEVSICKGIPLGSGLAGSAASAVAAIVAAEALLEQPLTLQQRYRYALIGETVASGSEQADNVAACLNGGLTLVDAVGQGVRRIPVPDAIRCAVVCPELTVETREARRVLEKPFPLDTCVRNSAHLASFLIGCFTGDLDLIRASLEDVLVEPRRAALVPGFTRVKQAALDHQALGCSLSGSGPAVFAWCPDESTARECASAMAEAFADAGLAANTLVSRVNVPGAHIVV